MKKQIISVLLLTSLSQADNFYLGIDMHELSRELSNPLISEPVFMILHKDLMNIWEGK
jgi:hypothetical protein